MMKRLEIILTAWGALYLIIALAWLFTGTLSDKLIMNIQMVWVSGMFLLCALNLFHEKASGWLQEKVKKS